MSKLMNDVKLKSVTHGPNTELTTLKLETKIIKPRPKGKRMSDEERRGKPFEELIDDPCKYMNTDPGGTNQTGLIIKKLRKRDADNGIVHSDESYLRFAESAKQIVIDRTKAIRDCYNYSRAEKKHRVGLVRISIDKLEKVIQITTDQATIDILKEIKNTLLEATGPTKNDYKEQKKAEGIIVELETA